MTLPLDAPERDIQGAILIAVTALPETCAWRSNSAMLRTLDGRRTVRANVPGTPDILGVHRGRGFGIEVKTVRGVALDSQRNFRRRWEAAGGLYIIARSVDDALTGLAVTA